MSNKYKPTKFLIHEESNDHMNHYEWDKSVFEQIQYSSDACITFVSCHHPEFTDNVVTLTNLEGQEYEFVKDVHGMLWSFSDWLSQAQCANGFELDKQDIPTAKPTPIPVAVKVEEDEQVIAMRNLLYFYPPGSDAHNEIQDHIRLRISKLQS